MSPIFLLLLMVTGTYTKSLFDIANDTISKFTRELKRKEAEIADEAIHNLQTTTTLKPGLLTWFLTPLTQNLQIDPQILQNGITQLKETLTNLGLRNRNDTKGKQLNANNLLHLGSGADSGFYTNRIEPAGFFGGNGWLANKGGILGGPGAILSTGSHLTDYPSAYRRK